MIVYVESNFVLEIALEQEQHTNCQTIIALAQQRALRLVLPAFSIAEPYEAIVRRARDRSRLASDFAKEIQQLTRSKSYQTESDHCKMFVRFDHAEKYILSQMKS